METPHTTAVQKAWHKRALQSLIGQLLLQTLIFIGGLLVIKLLVIKPFLGLFPLTAEQFKLVQGLITLAVVFALYNAMVRLLERRSVLELSMRHLAREGVLGSLLGLGAISLVMGVLWTAGYFRLLGPNPDAAVINILVPVVLFAAAEELFFRGILFRLVDQRKGTFWAFGVSALVFGALHITNEGADWITSVSAMSGGLLMCSLYAQTKRLWLPIFFHVFWNLGQVLYGTNVSGESILGKFYLSETTGPEWLTGGVQGPENSVLAIAVVLALLVWSYRKIDMRQTGAAPAGKEAG